MTAITATGVPALRAAGLRKSFGRIVVLDGIDLTVQPATLFALLGPNGAGKTTTVQIFSTLLLPDAGTAQVAGIDVAADPASVRAIIGVTGQFSAVDNLLTGQENLLLMADLQHLSRREGRRVAAESLERFELTDAARQPAATYSGGMRRRLDLAMTLIGRPAVVFLDEPTTGLDPRSRRATWQVIRSLLGSGTTIFLTTQYLEEADQIADRVAVLDRGAIVAEGTPDELKRRIPGGHARLSFADAASLEAAAAALPDASREDQGSLALRVPADDSPAGLEFLLGRLREHALRAERVTLHTPDLDDVFFALTSSSRH